VARCKDPDLSALCKKTKILEKFTNSRRCRRRVVATGQPRSSVFVARRQRGIKSAKQCRLLALSGHGDDADQCPLSGVKRTWAEGLAMSAYDPKRTLADAERLICDFTQGRLEGATRQRYFSSCLMVVRNRLMRGFARSGKQERARRTQPG
jgi:hypothetical protein